MAAVVVLATPRSGVEAQTAAPPTYTDSQATRGGAWYLSACEECHPSADFTSADFRLAWGGRNAFDLYERIRTTMPEATPGSLSRRAYTDIISYLLQLNGIPAGTVPLTADSLVLMSLRLVFADPPHASRH
jgi:hypothetical protein